MAALDEVMNQVTFYQKDEHPHTDSNYLHPGRLLDTSWRLLFRGGGRGFRVETPQNSGNPVWLQSWEALQGSQSVAHEGLQRLPGTVCLSAVELGAHECKTGAVPVQ